MRTRRVRLFTQAKIRVGPGPTPVDHETEYSLARHESPARTIRAMPLTLFTHARISPAPAADAPMSGAASDSTPSPTRTGVALAKKFGLAAWSSLVLPHLTPKEFEASRPSSSAASGESCCLLLTKRGCRSTGEPPKLSSKNSGWRFSKRTARCVNGSETMYKNQNHPTATRGRKLGRRGTP